MSGQPVSNQTDSSKYIDPNNFWDAVMILLLEDFDDHLLSHRFDQLGTEVMKVNGPLQVAFPER